MGERAKMEDSGAGTRISCHILPRTQVQSSCYYLRLGDFWSLHLVRLEKTDFERAARKMVRIARCIKK